MAVSLKPSPASTHLNTLDRRPAKASIAINRPQPSACDEVSAAVVSIVFETLAECGMADKEAAYIMAMDPAQLSRAKTGHARLTIDALWRLPDRFWLAFNRRVETEKHLTPANEKRLVAARVAELVRLIVEGVA